MNNTGKYIYCIIEGKPAPLNMEGSKVSFVRFKDIAALVKDAGLIDYQKLPKEVILKHLNSHQQVIEKVMEHSLPLPFKFGTYVTGLKDVKDILKQGYQFFKEILVSMKGKLEIEVIATFQDLEEVFKEIGENPLVKEFKEKIVVKPGGPAQEDKIKLGQMVKTLLDEKKYTLSREICAYLKTRSEDFCTHAVLNDRMILNGAFFLKEEDEDNFYRAVEELNKIHLEKIDFKCVGPLPLYSFNTVEIAENDTNLIEQSRKLLELDETININKIKESYRRLAKKYHPDNSGESKKKFEEMSKAYEFLMDFCLNYNFSLSPEIIKKEKIFKKIKAEA